MKLLQDDVNEQEQQSILQRLTNNNPLQQQLNSINDLYGQCPICGKQFANSMLSVHINNCLDSAGGGLQNDSDSGMSDATNTTNSKIQTVSTGVSTGDLFLSSTGKHSKSLNNRQSPSGQIPPLVLPPSVFSSPNQTSATMTVYRDTAKLKSSGSTKLAFTSDDDSDSHLPLTTTEDQDDEEEDQHKPSASGISGSRDPLPSPTASGSMQQQQQHKFHTDMDNDDLSPADSHFSNNNNGHKDLPSRPSKPRLPEHAGLSLQQMAACASMIIQEKSKGSGGQWQHLLQKFEALGMTEENLRRSVEQSRSLNANMTQSSSASAAAAAVVLSTGSPPEDSNLASSSKQSPSTGPQQSSSASASLQPQSSFLPNHSLLSSSTGAYESQQFTSVFNASVISNSNPITLSSSAPPLPLLTAPLTIPSKYIRIV